MMVQLIPGLFWLIEEAKELVEPEADIIPLTWPVLAH
jgi:hypothetical protein